jgi:hypothetical protein
MKLTTVLRKKRAKNLFHHGETLPGVKKLTYCERVKNRLRDGKVFPVGIVRGKEIYFRVADPRSDFIPSRIPDQHQRI